MPYFLHRSLVKPFEPSSRAAAFVGPKARKPAASISSTMPATSGLSGPPTTKSTASPLHNATTAAWSVMSIGTHSASFAMPALPGVHQSLVVSGEAAIFQASACSRPPEPRSRIFMGRDVAGFGARSPDEAKRNPGRTYRMWNPAFRCAPCGLQGYRSRRPRRQRRGIDLDHALTQPHPVGRELLGERGRRAAIGEAVLVAMPRARDEAVKDAAFAERAVLVGAEIGQRADLVAVAEHRDALAVRRDNDARPLVGDRVWRADREPAIVLARGFALAPRRRDVQRRHQPKRPAEKDRNEDAPVLLHQPERHIHDQHAVGDVERHMQPLPDTWGEEGEPEIVAGRGKQKQHGGPEYPERLDREADELAVAGARDHLVHQIARRALHGEPVDHRIGMRQRDGKGQHA